MQNEQSAELLSAHDFMERYMRRVPGHAIAWEYSLFERSTRLLPQELIDAAVDIAWEWLMPDSGLERPDLEIRRSGNYLIFSLLHETVREVLLEAA